MEVFMNTTDVYYVNGTVERICGEAPDEHQNFYKIAQFITGLIIYPIVCIIGIIGNSLTLIVLGHKDMVTSTNVYLSALAVSDTIKLINDFLYFVMLVLQSNNMDADKMVISNFYPYAHYIFQMSVCVTAWLTVSVAVERYIAVCYPTKAKEMCTIVKARIVSTVVFLSMILLTIPSALKYEAVQKYDPIQNTSCYDIRPSTLGANEAFMEPYTWVQSSLRSIIPLIVLIFLNARIINALRKQRVKGKKLSSRNRITLMLIAIIIFFVVCIMPDAIMSLFFGFGYVDESNYVKGIREITDSLLAINSAFNFVLYCSMSKVFRSTFEKIFRVKCPTKKKKSSKRLITNGHNATANATIGNPESEALNQIGNNNKHDKETFL